jgi:hypothetical protein
MNRYNFEDYCHGQYPARIPLRNRIAAAFISISCVCFWWFLMSVAQGIFNVS